jgi:hypothetical protein
MPAGGGRSIPVPLSAGRGSAPAAAAGVAETTGFSRGAAAVGRGGLASGGGASLAAGAGPAPFATPCVTIGTGAAMEVTAAGSARVAGLAGGTALAGSPLPVTSPAAMGAFGASIAASGSSA